MNFVASLDFSCCRFRWDLAAPQTGTLSIVIGYCVDVPQIMRYNPGCQLHVEAYAVITILRRTHRLMCNNFFHSRRKVRGYPCPELYNFFLTFEWRFPCFFVATCPIVHVSCWPIVSLPPCPIVKLHQCPGVPLPSRRSLQLPEEMETDYVTAHFSIDWPWHTMEWDMLELGDIFSAKCLCVGETARED